MLQINMLLLVGHGHFAFHSIVQRYGMVWYGMEQNLIPYHIPYH